MITSFEIRVTRNPKTGNWHLDVTAGSALAIIVNDRTRRGYSSAEDAITSSRHLVKQLIKCEESESEIPQLNIDRVAAIHEAVETAAAKHAEMSDVVVRPIAYGSFLCGAISALQAAFAPDNHTFPPEVHLDWVKVAFGIGQKPARQDSLAASLNTR